MNLEETPQEHAFRAEVREWLAENIASIGAFEQFSDRLEADRRLAGAGYLGYHWPERFGGGGGTPNLAAILDAERAEAGVPASSSPSRFGINLLGPTLMVHGTPEQQHEFLPPILRAEAVWCQGFSEPEAGSDLANVQCAGRLEGDALVLEGSKVWTTQAHEADWCFGLVRTDPEGPPAPQPVVRPDRHAPGGHRDPAAGLAHRTGRVQPGVLRGRQGGAVRRGG
jgi:alkylation response protein AidB-like acyl-CoA dehydrogenase